MSPELGLAVMMNNYFHDVATALLVASAIAMWIMVSSHQGTEGEAASRYLLVIYGRMTRLARFSLGWIILGGIPRTLAYEQFEWANAVGKMQVPALIVKHVIVFALVGTGAWMWVKLSRKMRTIRSSLPAQAVAAGPGTT